MIKRLADYWISVQEKHFGASLNECIKPPKVPPLFKSSFSSCLEFAGVFILFISKAMGWMCYLGHLPLSAEAKIC